MSTERHNSQRGWFGAELYEQMGKNDKVWLLVGDLGYKQFDKIRDEYPDRFVNCGASEQAMAGIAVGLALKGKIVFAYSITPFLLRRPYETIKLYIDGENIPVKLVGSGRDKDYAHDGPSHDATDVKDLLKTLPNIEQLWPETKEDVPGMVEQMIKEDKPFFLSLKR
jgi:transketolase